MRNFWLDITKHHGKIRAVEHSREGKVRLRMMLWYEEHGRNAALTCRHFGVSRDMFYRWRRRYEQSGVGGLEDGSHRPKRVRKPTWSKELELAVLELRQLTPGWGKDKLAVLLRQQGWPVTFITGVRRADGSISGHAWIEYEGRVLPELREPVHQYALMFRYPDQSATNAGSE